MSIVDTARAWIAQDPDPETRAELQALIRDDDRDSLEARFAGALEFGTAGLRGLLGAGPTRMNRVTVARATAGLCAWLEHEVADARSRGICIGRDARPKSDVFEQEVVEVATGAGFQVFFFDELVPTPVLAFSVLRLGAAAGVMITASHNPPGYNGYKVYWENAAQIIPPNDIGIAREMRAVGPWPEIPRLSSEQAREGGLSREIDAMKGDYVAAIAGEPRPTGERRPVRVAYTPLHGVAAETFRRLLSRAGFDDVRSVPDQSDPDGSFPTVAFPNPEEPGAMNRVLQLAREIEADLAVANDPDGDRVAAAVRRGDGYEVLSGNDIGVLLADDLLKQAANATRPCVLSTIVSSPLLGPIAEHHGAYWEQTPTGHKWIQNRALELQQQGYTYVFGYEEALGYAPSTQVRDKDGISSALRLVDMTSRLKASGKDLLDARDTLFRKYGFVADRQVSRRFDGRDPQADMKRAVERLRQKPPSRIAGVPVLGASNSEGNLLIFELEGGHRVMLRPSGTEPKLKYYFYVLGRVSTEADLDAAKAGAQALLQRMVADVTASFER